MIRTKYLLIALIACMVLVVTAGSFGVSKQTGPQVLSENGEMFFVPAQGEYAIISADSRDASKARRAFIEKIQTDVRENPLPMRIEEPVTPEPPVEDVHTTTDVALDVVVMPDVSTTTTLIEEPEQMSEISN